MQPLIFIDAVSVISKFFPPLLMSRLIYRWSVCILVFVFVVVKKLVNGKLSMAIEWSATHRLLCIRFNSASNAHAQAYATARLEDSGGHAKMSRETLHSQPYSTLFRHSAVLSLPPVLLRKLTNLVHYTGKDSVLTVVFVFIKMVLVPSVVNCGDFFILLVFFLFEGK